MTFSASTFPRSESLPLLGALVFATLAALVHLAVAAVGEALATIERKSPAARLIWHAFIACLVWITAVAVTTVWILIRSLA